MSKDILRKEHELGLGGVAIGTAFEKLTDEQSFEILNKAWNEGIRYYDTSPWYGLTKSERRFGEFLKTKRFCFLYQSGKAFYRSFSRRSPKNNVERSIEFRF